MSSDEAHDIELLESNKETNNIKHCSCISASVTVVGLLLLLLTLILQIVIATELMRFVPLAQQATGVLNQFSVIERTARDIGQELGNFTAEAILFLPYARETLDHIKDDVERIRRCAC